MQRAVIFGFLGMLGCAVILPANATPAVDRVLSDAMNIVRAADECGTGQRWIPPGYGRKGKYRPGHCTSR